MNRPSPLLKAGLAGLALLVIVGAGLAANLITRRLRSEAQAIQATATTAPVSAAQTQAETAAPAASTQTKGEVNASTIPDAPPTDGSVTLASSMLTYLVNNARHVQGDAAAPLTVIEFSDFKCPFCAQFTTSTLDLIRENYVETGYVRYIYSPMATLGLESLRAAEAGECAAEQGQFWAYHDRIFADQASVGSQLTDEALAAMAADLGLDTTAFETCLASGKYSELIQQESQTAKALGVRGTPGFIINGFLVIGAQPYEAFAEAFQAELTSLGVEPPDDPRLERARQIEALEGLTTFPPQPVGEEIMSAAIQNCGIYDQPVLADNVLRAMVHGAVWVAYHPNLPEAQIEGLRNLVRQAIDAQGEALIILAPEPNLNASIVATAWRAQLEAAEATDPRLSQFLKLFQNGPFAPEPDVPCSGGVGNPLG